MQPIHQRFDVGFRYAVHFTEDAFAPANATLVEALGERSTPGPARALIALDEGARLAHPALKGAIEAYARAHADALEWVAPPLAVPGGEAAKNDPAVVDRLLRAIKSARLCRHSYVVAVGGGAALDAIGYAAAIAHRGLRLIRMPTTVLAQCDSGVGVKNAVNAFGKKNFLGVFAPPFAVVNDFALLRSLSERDWRAGLAEAVKVAVVKDADFFARLESSAAALIAREEVRSREIIRHCARLHLEHIARGGDPFELGSSRPLDFGHWSAHKLEQLTEYRIRHGEAVAIGIALDTLYAEAIEAIDAGSARRIVELLVALGFDLFPPEVASAIDRPESLLAGLEEFREHLGGGLTILLPAAVGRAVEVNAIDSEAMIASLARLESLARGIGPAAEGDAV
jgi:3-dehydroquinate synthase